MNLNRDRGHRRIESERMMGSHNGQNNGPTVCAFTQDLKAYLDNELPLAQRLRMRTHLSQCGTCREAMAEMERIGNEMRKIGAIDAVLSPEMRARLVKGLEEVRPGDADVPRTPPLWRQRPWLVFGGGGITVAASLLVFFMLYGPTSTFLQANSGPSFGSARENMEAADAPETAAAAPAALPPIVATKSQAMARIDSNGNIPAPVRQRLMAAMEAKKASHADVAAGVAVYGDAPDSNRRGAVGKAAVAAVGQSAPLSAVGGSGTRAGGEGRAAVAGGNGPVQVAQAGAARSASPPVALSESPALLDERQVHREASLGVAVSSVEQADNQVVTLVEGAGGYIANNNLNTDESGFKYAELTVKVPVKEFDTILAEIAKMGDLRSKTLTGEDITDKVSDATSDEQVLVDEVQKLNNRIKEGGMGEKRIAQTEAEIRETRLQLARTRARLGLLRKMSSLSTLQISLTEKAKKQVEKPNDPPFLRDLRETNRAAMTAFQSAVRVPIVMIVWVLAFSPLWIPLILAYRWASLKNRRQE